MERFANVLKWNWKLKYATYLCFSITDSWLLFYHQKDIANDHLSSSLNSILPDDVHTVVMSVVF